MLLQRTAKLALTLSIAGVVTGLRATTADASVLGWNAAHGGSFFDSNNWQHRAVPGTHDEVVFNRGAQYGVWLNKSYTNSRMLVGNDAINLNLNGHRYHLDADTSGSLLMGLKANDAAGLNLTNGTLRSSKGRLAYAPGTFANVNVFSTATWRNTGPLVVGQKGRAEMTISGGKVSSDGGRIGSANGGRGKVHLTGPTAAWRIGGALHVGGNGPKGKLTLSDDAYVKVKNRLNISEDGKVVLDGGTLSVGTFKSYGEFDFREGTLRLRDQGLTIGDGRQFGEQLDLSTGKTIKLGGAAEVNTNSTLNLLGGTFATAETMYNKGLIRMTQGSLLAAESVNIRNTLAGSGDIRGDVLFQDSGNLVLELGGRNPGVSYDRIVIDGDATLTNVEVKFKNGFVPRAGDHFELVTADEITYSPGFTVSLPDLPDGLQFEIRQDETCLHAFVVVPEPGTVALLVGAAGLLFKRRR